MARKHNPRAMRAEGENQAVVTATAAPIRIKAMKNNSEAMNANMV